MYIAGTLTVFKCTLMLIIIIIIIIIIKIIIIIIINTLFSEGNSWSDTL